MTKFGQIPTHLICRFGELTKTEIVVVSFLYACRNAKTGQCNPSRGAISREVRIAKPHVSTAVKSLEDKEWLFEQPNGNFLLTDPPERVTKSVTPAVTKSVTPDPTEGVTKSVTGGYEIRNSLYIEQTMNTQEEKEGALVLEFPADESLVFLSEYKRFFPHNNLTIFQQDKIKLRISDLAVWVEALDYWASNDHRAQSIGKLCDKYDELVAAASGKEITNGQNRRLSEREKSSQRNANGERLAEAIANGDTEAVERILSGTRDNHPQIRLISQRTGS